MQVALPETGRREGPQTSPWATTTLPPSGPIPRKALAVRRVRPTAGACAQASLGQSLAPDQEAARAGAQCKSLGPSQEQPRALKWLEGGGWGQLIGGQTGFLEEESCQPGAA